MVLSFQASEVLNDSVEIEFDDNFEDGEIISIAQNI